MSGASLPDQTRQRPRLEIVPVPGPGADAVAVAAAVRGVRVHHLRRPLADGHVDVAARVDRRRRNTGQREALPGGADVVPQLVLPAGLTARRGGIVERPAVAGV